MIEWRPTDRYQYDMDAVDSAVQELAAQLEASNVDEVEAEVRIDSDGNLHIGAASFKNLSPAAKESRIKALKLGLQDVVRRVILRANGRSAQPAPEVEEEAAD